MTTTTRTGARDAPPLADVAVVHEDGEWVLVRHSSVAMFFLYTDPPGWWSAKGFVWLNPSLRQWETVFNRQSIFHGDLDEAIAALWAARGTG